MITKRKLKETVVLQSNRIEELEERLCPCESHQWVKVDYSFVGGTGVGDETTIYKYKCQRCGKTVNSWKLLKEADHGAD